MKNYITLENLSFSFEEEQISFFENISFKIEKQGLIFVTGQNGIGKSTLFRLLKGIIHARENCSGTLKIKDKIYDLSLQQDRNTLQKNTRLLHQSFDFMLASKFTSFENLAFSKFHRYPHFSLVQVKQNIPTFMDYFNIPLDKPVTLLSGGQRQMLALVMVAQKPIDLLLLDEPTASLDHKNSDYIMQGIRKLSQERNICILCISHDLDLIEKHADYILSLKEDLNGKKIVLLKENERKETSSH
ncbi:energy-coupling factor ABC transporter ATP-binding protein [Candidatus Dependentiae bacterium]|nr:energy-coupling factor ABC transporter ATP-binding protein [Candidatus Dependentiae bacterium]